LGGVAESGVALEVLGLSGCRTSEEDFESLFESQAKVTGAAVDAFTVGLVSTASISLRESRCAKATATATNSRERPEPVTHIVHFFMTTTSLSVGQNLRIAAALPTAGEDYLLLLLADYILGN
jgi:hypothetical protein